MKVVMIWVHVDIGAEEGLRFPLAVANQHPRHRSQGSNRTGKMTG